MSTLFGIGLRYYRAFRRSWKSSFNGKLKFMNLKRGYRKTASVSRFSQYHRKPF